jgi:CBS domain containing-hemolysin-like protein
VARPLITLLNALANGVVRLLGIEPRDELLDAAEADEIAAMVAASRDEGLIEDVEHQLLTGALDLGVRDVGSVLVPRDQIVRVSRAATAAEAEQVVVDSGHSRLVVVGADVDDVLGYVHAKEFLTVPAAARARPLPLGRIRRLPVVSPDRPIDDVLLIMQRARVHLALVQDQRGHTVGIVSMEDLLEALVGDIVDETDQPATGDGEGNGSVTVNHVTRSQ